MSWIRSAAGFFGALLLVFLLAWVLALAILMPIYVWMHL
jgi:hypothetical protein